MIDTHTHLYFPDYKEGIKEIVDQCLQAGVSYLILPNVDEESIPQMKEFHANFPEISAMAMALHPTEVKEGWETILENVKKELATGAYIAVGETGMDLYWEKDTEEIQKKSFERHLLLAEKFRLPVIIHCRDAVEATMEVIEKVKPSVPLIFHSFTGDKADVARIRQGCDPWFGINGVVTFKNAPGLREALPEIGLERILLETDSPYLAPVPHRGKPNRSSYLPHIRDKVAECLGVSPKEVEETTDKNAQTVFRL